MFIYVNVETPLGDSMHVGDIQSFELKKHPSGSFIRVFTKEELRFLGFSEKDLDKDELPLVMQADFSKKYKQEFLGFAKRR
jgi:hypothetical protein